MSCFLPSTTGFFLQDFLQESFLTWVRFHRTLLEKACPEDNLVRSCPRWPADWISLWVTGSFHSRSRISQWYLSPVQRFGFQLSQTYDRCNLPLHMPVQLSVPCLRKCKSRVTAEPREGDHAWENSCSAERHTRGFWWKPGSGSQEKCYSGLKTALLGRAQDQQLKYKKIHLRGRLEKVQQLHYKESERLPTNIHSTVTRIFVSPVKITICTFQWKSAPHTVCTTFTLNTSMFQSPHNFLWHVNHFIRFQGGKQV